MHNAHCAVAWFIRFFRCSFVAAAAAAPLPPPPLPQSASLGCSFLMLPGMLGMGMVGFSVFQREEEAEAGKKLLCVVGWFYGASSNVWLALSPRLARSYGRPFRVYLRRCIQFQWEMFSSRFRFCFFSPFFFILLHSDSLLFFWSCKNIYKNVFLSFFRLWNVDQNRMHFPFGKDFKTVEPNLFICYLNTKAALSNYNIITLWIKVLMNIKQ